MEQRAIVDLLGKTALFGSLADADRAAIAARMRRVDFTPDQMIFSRGDPGREIYLVLEGRIRLSSGESSLSRQSRRGRSLHVVSISPYCTATWIA